MTLGFAKYPIGQNCRDNNKKGIVATSDECKIASDSLGLNYKGSIKNELRPAGCYWRKTESHFNKIVDSSQTNPNAFKDRGGVCVIGKFGITIEEQIFT